MRARDFVMERRRTWGIGDITLHFDDFEEGDPPGLDYHRHLRQIERGVSDQERDAILKQLPMVRRPMLEFTRGQEFWLYDPKLDKAVGLRVMDRQSKQYKVKTVLGKKPWRDDYMLTVPGVDPASLQEELVSEIDRRGFLRGLGAAALAGVGGQALAKAPAKYEYVKVQPGDTVYSIARAFSTTPQEIQRLNRLGPDFQIEVNQELRVPVPQNTRTIEPQKQKPQPQAQTKTADAAQPGKKPTSLPTLTGTRAEQIAKQTALNAGIRGIELAAFLSQIKHETTDFTSMFERGSKNYFQRMYDIAYRPAKAEKLGNDNVGDGVRYRGRGFIQLTGRDNYRRAGRRLGLDLENNPDLAARPDVAARVAVLYWKQRVRPNVQDWTNVRQVTLPINGGLNGLADREQNFRQYVKFYGLGKKT